MKAIEIIGFVIGVLAVSGFGYIIIKLLVSFAKMNENSLNIFKNKHNGKI